MPYYSHGLFVQVPKLVTCTGAFGAQTENVNLSLTGIGETGFSDPVMNFETKVVKTQAPLKEISIVVTGWSAAQYMEHAPVWSCYRCYGVLMVLEESRRYRYDPNVEVCESTNIRCG